jgi:hypothetical protein
MPSPTRAITGRQSRCDALPIGQNDRTERLPLVEHELWCSVSCDLAAWVVKRLGVGAVALVWLAASCASAMSAQSGTGPTASIARSCSPYTVVARRTFGGQHYIYTVRIHQITARGTSCAASKTLIRRADNTADPHGPGDYRSVPPWQCRAFRPFGGGPHGEFMWFEDCKRAGGHRLRWTETQLKVTKT